MSESTSNHNFEGASGNNKANSRKLEASNKYCQSTSSSQLNRYKVIRGDMEYSIFEGTNKNQVNIILDEIRQIPKKIDLII